MPTNNRYASLDLEESRTLSLIEDILLNSDGIR